MPLHAMHENENCHMGHNMSAALMMVETLGWCMCIKASNPGESELAFAIGWVVSTWECVSNTVTPTRPRPYERVLGFTKRASVETLAVSV